MRNNLMKLSALLAFASATAAPAQAQSPTADLDDDLRCLALISAALSQMEADRQGPMVAGVMYFVGRVDGRAPGTDLRTELQRIASTLTDEKIATEGQRCSAILTEKGQMLQAVGAGLQAKE
jgi:hypothetical protein